MCDKAISENRGTLKKIVEHCYKNQQMWDKAIEN